MKNNEKFWQIKNKTETSADIYLYDEIGDSWYGESTSAKGFKKELDKIGDVKILNIYINSPGGSVFDGMAIYNQLKRHKAQKNVYVDGFAASIASVIALAGDKITIPKNAYFMIHQPWSITWGNAAEFRRMADALDTIEDGILNVYEGHSYLSRDRIKKMMEDETWMTGEEAFAYGFADEVGEEIQVAASVAKSEIWGKFKKAPKVEQKLAANNLRDDEKKREMKSKLRKMSLALKERQIAQAERRYAALKNGGYFHEQ